MNRSHAALAAAAVTAVLAGCGGDSNKQLSYSDFISKANGVCTKGQAEVAKAGTPEATAKALEQAVNKFKELRPPDKLKPAYDQFVSISEQQLEKVKAGDIGAANALGPKSNEAAARMGTEGCISQ
jgi:ABC-type glycerol-3-phosphate transport system substrate-binding protein